MLRIPWTALVCVLIAALLGAVGQHLLKEGATRSATSHGLGFLLSPWVWTGMVCYVLVMMLFTHAFRQGGTVTVLYPIYASTFIWAAVLGMLFYGQPIRPVHVLGMLLLVAGMYLMGVGNASS